MFCDVIDDAMSLEKLEKPLPIFSKTLFLGITRPYNLLVSENIFRDFLSEKFGKN